VSGVEERTYVETSRREKRATLEALGVPAFAYRLRRLARGNIVVTRR